MTLFVGLMIFTFLRVHKTFRPKPFFKSMSERIGSDIQRWWIRSYPALIKWLGSELPLKLTLKDIPVNFECKLGIAPQNIYFATAQLLGRFNQYQWRWRSQIFNKNSLARSNKVVERGNPKTGVEVAQSCSTITIISVFRAWSNW